MLRKIKFSEAALFKSLISGVLLSLPFFNGKFWLFAWFGFIPLFLALKGKSGIQAFFLASLSGVVFWSLVIFWLVHVTLPGTIVLILYLSLYFGIFGLVSRKFSFQPEFWQAICISSLWVLLEYCRGYLFTGFPWALIGYSQYLLRPVIQIADITGAWGVSFLVVLINAGLYSLLASRPLPAREKFKKHSWYIIVLVVSLLYGYLQINRLQHLDASRRITACVIQGNIPQEMKWDSRNNDLIIDKYLKLTTEVSGDVPDLVIWPEASLPVILEEDPGYYQLVRSSAKAHNLNLLFGAVTLRDNLYYNSALLVSGTGQLLNRYDKIHLVPFGEYIPLRRALPFLQTIVPIGDVERGKVYRVFSLPGRRAADGEVKFSVLICFEDLFPGLARRFVNEGAEFLVNITNDAWYKKTPAAIQHFQASVFRAVENRVFLVRSANTGISGFVSPSGEVLSLVSDLRGRNIFVDGYKLQQVFCRRNTGSFYTRYGDLFIALCGIIYLFGLNGFPRKR